MMTMAVEELIRGCGDLPSLPDVYHHVRSVVNDPDADMDDLATALSTDPAVTAKLLKLVNSPLYSLSDRVVTVPRAASILGMGPIHDLVLATSAAASFSKLSFHVMNVRLFWQHSVYRGLLARDVGRICRANDPERLFTIGILSDLGHLVMYLCLPELASDILVHARKDSTLRADLEEERLGFEAGMVGSTLLQSWQLPEEFYQPIREHMTIGRSTVLTTDMAILHLAGVLAECRLVEIPLAVAPFFMDESVVAHLGISTDEVPSIAEEAERGTDSVVDMICPAA